MTEAVGLALTGGILGLAGYLVGVLVYEWRRSVSETKNNTDKDNT